MVEEAVIKTIPKKKKCKKVKWLSEEALQVAEKRREAKGKGEKERYIHLNAELQRVTRRDTFLDDQGKEIEENNRMGKTRYLFKKIKDTKGTFHATMGTIKGRSGMDLTEAEDTKKRWQEYTEEIYKKDLHDPDNHDGVMTHPESDILEYEVKWALGSITMNKAIGGYGIPVKLFQILKDNVVKSAALSMPASLENSTVATGLEKVTFYSNPKERQYQRILKLPHNCTFQMFKLNLEKAEEPEIKLSTSVGSLEKQENSRKTSTSALLITPKPLTVWITTNCGKFFKRWEYQTTLPAS